MWVYKAYQLYVSLYKFIKSHFRISNSGKLFSLNWTNITSGRARAKPICNPYRFILIFTSFSPKTGETSANGVSHFLQLLYWRAQERTHRLLVDVIFSTFVGLTGIIWNVSLKRLWCLLLFYWCDKFAAGVNFNIILKSFHTHAPIATFG